MLKSYYQSQNEEINGFTLVELLISIVIVGVLAAVSLPSYLNQASKARASDAKSGLGSLNRSQQAYRLENNTFSNSTSLLEIKVSAKNFSYGIGTTNKDDSVSTATPIQTDMKSYASGIAQGSNDTVILSLCESEKVLGEPSYQPAQASAIGGTNSPSSNCLSGNNID